jgi:anti-sigma-K factor RskA
MTPPRTPDERLLAYVDGELPDHERVAFEAEMRADPSLASEVERQRRLGSTLGQAYAPVLGEPVPMRLTAAASAANERGRPRFGAPQWAAMAACLVVGVLAGRAALPDRGPLVMEDDVLVARGGLAEALSTRLAAEPGVVRVGLTFRAADGRYCRTFQSEMDRLAGLACREDGRWEAVTTTAFHPAADPAYRTAGSETPPAVLAAVDDLIDGAPFDAAAERAARDKGWTP